MASNNALGMNENHVGGYFEWELEPTCSCGMFLKAIMEEKMVFVSDLVENDFNMCYIMSLSADGSLTRDTGVTINYCPWCGEKIQGRKLYPNK